MKGLIIKSGTLVDVNNLTTSIQDIQINKNGYIERIEKGIQQDGYDIIDASGLLVTPGLVDIHVHFREPGYEHKEDIKSGMESAVAGGFTTVACMPNTKPTIDSSFVVDYINSRAREVGLIDLKIIGSITKGLEDDKLSNICEMKDKGIVAISDDGKTPMNMELYKKANKIASKLDLPMISHCEDHDLSKDGHINEGSASIRTGIRGIPSRAEYNIVERDVRTAIEYDSKIHIAHVSVKESIVIIEKYKKEGTKVTCEVAPHHFILDDSIINRDSTYTKVNPPLRSKEDVEAIKEGIRKGIIDIIASDHAPHDLASKDVTYEKAAFGISGLETSFALSYTHLVKTGIIPIEKLVYMMTKKPLEIINENSELLTVGQRADLAIIDLMDSYEIDSDRFYSQGRNTPFDGMKVYGRVLKTIKNGRLVYQYNKEDLPCL